MNRRFSPAFDVKAPPAPSAYANLSSDDLLLLVDEAIATASGLPAPQPAPLPKAKDITDAQHRVAVLRPWAESLTDPLLRKAVISRIDEMDKKALGDIATLVSASNRVTAPPVPLAPVV